MGKAFFDGWELWQKMTFVLGVCIFIVFCIAYGKLVWMNRYVERQEVIDEEKSAKIQQLRQSGQFVESPNTQNIPFGVRAIQSGVQVDGIWISNSPTPVPNETIPGRLSGNPPDNVQESEIRHSPSLAFDERASSSPKATRLPTGRGHHLGIKELDSSVIEHIDDARRPGSVRNRNSYQPQQFSYGRLDSHGAYLDDSQGQLSGNASRETTTHAHRPLRSQGLYADAESSAADNERDSGTSFDSDATSFEGNARHGPLPVGPKPIPTKSCPGYVKVPTESPLDEISDPFANPMRAPLQSERPFAQGDRVSNSPNKSIDRTQLTYPQPHSVPSDLHSNNSVRKVNSGFEILSAGTFTALASYKGKAADRGDRFNDVNERRSQKLEKKGRYSSKVDRYVSND